MSFVKLINDSHTLLDTFKFVDDETLCEVVTNPSISQMQLARVKLSTGRIKI